MTTPLHERIAADLRDRIVSGRLAVGDHVPSESELQQEWQGSRAPVRQALAALRAEGLIAGPRGRPPVVQKHQVSQPFDTLLSFSSWVQLMGSSPGQRTVEIARRGADAAVAEHLEIEVGDPVVQLVRLRSMDDEPVMVERTSFKLKYGKTLFEHDPDAGSIYAHLISQGLEVGVASHVIDAVPANDQDRRLLGVGIGTPLLREQRTAHTVDGDVFEFSDDRYRADRVSFTIHNTPEGRASLGRTQPSGS
ncbi:GntR family transcriptional regulator [Gryllotalpicola reticulitermitis]|uniref:GntR family transcriptional regulator n=1 Tax=Gryllotalpicola reticulitermitis TaxID=1184153 RepID=A0ABV8QB82_9MICO